jgi:1A family penicillin-binding protein
MRFLRSIPARIHAKLTGRPRVVIALVSSLAILVFLAGGYAAWFTYGITAGLPSRDTLRAMGDMAQATTILDANDKTVFTIFKEQRIEVPLERVSPNLIKAVVSVEDQRFFEHSGVDFVRVAAAFLRNVEEGRRAEGGSTITQQLARQSFLSRDKTYRRKLREVVLAAYIENVYDKNDILELYLNKVYFGDGLYGVEAASRGYFAKPAADLNVEEAALLAGLIQSPSSYAPTVNMERAVARRNVVLQAMVASKAIDEATAERARRIRVKLTNGLEVRETFGLYFKEEVRKELVERFGWQRVYQGGLRVYTTMDPDLQRTAEQLVEKGLLDIEKRPGFKHPKRGLTPVKEGQAPSYLQGALVSMDPSSGFVRALVGGRDFDESHFDRATQAKRQSGSAFKPFVYAAALEAGYSPATVITRLNDPIQTLQGAWVPEDEHSSAASMTMRQALKTSSNRAAVQLLNAVGIPAAVASAERLNVGTPPSVPSLALGAGDVTLMSLTAAYGAFASGGIVRDPVLIRRVEDSDGTVLYRDQQKSRRAVSAATAFMMSSMLADVINHGTGYRARQAGFTMPAAGKTGTTNDYVDAWFVGFTPRVVTGVWIGFDQPQTIIANGYGGELAVPIWAGFMKTATRGHEPSWFTAPPDVISVNVCRISGKLPNDGCSNVEAVTPDGFVESRSLVYTEFFLKGTQPTSVCPLHPAPSFFDRLTGALGGDSPKPVMVDRAPLPPPPAASTTGSGDRISGGVLPQPPAQAKPPEKDKKRGFWSRIFGKDKKQDPPAKKKPGGG